VKNCETRWKKTGFIWGIYGLAVAVLCIYYSLKHLSFGVMPGRAAHLFSLLDKDILAVFEYFQIQPDHNVAYFIYCWLYGSFFREVFGMVLSPERIFKSIWAIMMCVPFVLVTLWSWKLYKKSALSFVAPWLFFYCTYPVSFAFRDECTWFMSWTVYTGFLLLCLLKQENGEIVPKGSMWIAMLLCIGWGNVGRLHASLGITCLLIFMLVLTCYRKGTFRHTGNHLKRLVVSIGVILSVYVSFTGIIPKLLYAAYGMEGTVNYQAVWHTMYIGLGWFNPPNDKKYKEDKSARCIVYNDSCAGHFVKSRDASVKYLSPEYMEILRHEIWRIMREEPRFFISSYSGKFMWILFEILRIHWKFMLFMIGWAGFHKWRGNSIQFSSKEIYFALVFLCFFDFSFPMIAVPRFTYMQGCLGAYAMLQFVFAMDLLRNVNVSKLSLLLARYDRNREG